MFLFLLVVIPFQRVHASSEFESIIQYVSNGYYEEGVTLLNDWFIERNYDQQEVLSLPYRELLNSLSSTHLSHENKMLELWSFVSLATYVTESKIEYTRFLESQLERSWAEHEQNPTTGELDRIEQLYSAMLPTLQMMVQRGDHTSIASLNQSGSVPYLLISTNDQTLPVFQQWYGEQVDYSNLLIVSFITGMAVITTLIYVSWRKYDGEIRRKKIRDHNN